MLRNFVGVCGWDLTKRFGFFRFPGAGEHFIGTCCNGCRYDMAVGSVWPAGVRCNAYPEQGQEKNVIHVACGWSMVTLGIRVIPMVVRQWCMMLIVCNGCS